MESYGSRWCFTACKAAEKTIPFEDTLTPYLYQTPSQYDTGWGKATASQKEAAQISDLEDSLPVCEGPRARAKKLVYPQRERSAADHRTRLSRLRTSRRSRGSKMKTHYGDSH